MDLHQLPILVGNGPSVGAHDWGRIVDSFATVIRINSFPFTGFERQAGVRCDTWVVTPTKPRPVPPCQEVVAFVISPDNPVRQREFALANYGPRLTLVDRPEVVRLATPFGFSRMDSVWPSTGATAVMYFSARYPFVVYHGFDHLVGAEAGTPHYYPAVGAPLAGVHAPRLERAVFETLVARGRATPLAALLGGARPC